MPGFLKPLLLKTINSVYPPTCVYCLKPGHNHLDLCQNCLDKLNPIKEHCPTCALPVFHSGTFEQPCGKCLRNPSYLDFAGCPFEYNGIIVDIIHQMKFQRRIASARLLGKLMSDYFENRKIDMIIPVPTHRKTLFKRGFNQTEIIAGTISRNLGIEYSNRVIIKSRHTRHQSTLNNQDRLKNLKDSFEVCSSHILSEKRIAVIDDVMTTGTTMNLIARLLKENGAAHVEGWAAARTLLNH